MYQKTIEGIVRTTILRYCEPTVSINNLKEQPKTKTYGIYSVTEEWQPDGRWAGYRCQTIDSIGKKQGKLYIKSDGRENYQAQPPSPPPSKPKDKDEELEID